MSKKNPKKRKLGNRQTKKVYKAEDSVALRLYNAGKTQEAETACANELQANPHNPTALYVIGMLSLRQNQILRAAEFFSRAITAQPKFAKAHFQLGSTYNSRGILHEAIKSYQKAINLGFKTPEIFSHLGHTLKKLGKSDQAIKYYKKALKIDHQYYLAWNSLGVIFFELGQHEDIANCYKRSIAIHNSDPSSYCNLAYALLHIGSLQEAENCCNRALELDEKHTPAYKNLGAIYEKMGAVNEATAFYKQSLALEPDCQTHSSILMNLNYLTTTSQEKIYAESLRWDTLYATPHLPTNEANNVHGLTIGRQLKIGYLSPDFCDHSVAYFIEPAIRSHNRENVEIHCYSNVATPDAVTQRLQGAADEWHNIWGMDDSQVTALIRRNKIDILVDLAGHTKNNRLQVFAQRPAPVQITWIGYPNTTGLKAIGYRLTDTVADPPGDADELYSEKLIRLANGFLCYQPETSSPPTGQPPCLKNGYITFGSFNNTSKMSTEVVRLWAKILNSSPGSRLILKSGAFEKLESKKRHIKIFEDAGVAAKRIDLLGKLPNKKDHLTLYNKIDIGLDPFPYNGTTTTCEALWMGVPVITLRGHRHSGRVGASIMHHTGLEELIAESQEEYKALALSLAHDTNKLTKLRDNLREKLKQSSLMDSQQFTKTLEEVYREMCQQQSGLEKRKEHHISEKKIY